MKNSTSAPLKRSSVDKLINKQILILFMILLVLCLLSASCSEWWSYTHGENDWYLGCKLKVQCCVCKLCDVSGFIT